MSRAAKLFFTFLPLVIGWAAVAADDQSGSEYSESQRARALVAQLGADQFAAREKATDELIRLGLAALPALEEGRDHTDREIRYRCRRIGDVVRENDFQRRLEAFARNQDEGEAYDLPGWTEFREMLGHDPTARALFVEIQKEESDSMKAFADGPKAVASTLEVRTQQLIQATRLFRSEVPLGSVAAMLIMSANEEISLSPQASSSLYSLCYQSSFQQAMIGGPHQQQMRKLLGAWIRRGSDWSAYQAMSLAMLYDLEEGLVPATRALANMGSQVHIRQYAILTIGKMGGDEHIPLLEGLLEDTTLTSQRTINRVKYQTQLRDVALATLLHMTKQDHKKFGFERIQAHSRMLFNTSTLGFKDDEQRKAALDKWHEFRAEQKNAEQ